MSGSGKKLTEKQKKELAEKQREKMLQDIRDQAGGLTREGVKAKNVLAGGASRVVAPHANIFLQGLTDIETRLNKDNKTITFIPEALKSRIEKHAIALKAAEKANITGLTLQQINEQKAIISQVTALRTESMPAKRQGVNVVSALASSLGGLMSSLRRKSSSSSSSGEREESERGSPTIGAPTNVQWRNPETGEFEDLAKAPPFVPRNPLQAPMLPTGKAKEVPTSSASQHIRFKQDVTNSQGGEYGKLKAPINVKHNPDQHVTRSGHSGPVTPPERTAKPPPLPPQVLARRAAQEQAAREQAAKKRIPPPLPKRAPVGSLHGQIQQGTKLKHVEDKDKRDRSAPSVKKQYSNTAGNRAGVRLDKPVAPPRPAAAVLPSQKKLGSEGGTPKSLTQTGQGLTIDQKLAAAKQARNAQEKEAGKTPSWVKKKGPNDY